MRVRRIRVLWPQHWSWGSRRSPPRRTRWEVRNLRIRRVLLCSALILIAAWIGFAVASAHLRPIISQMASARVSHLATNAIHDAIGKRLDEGEYSYDRLIKFEKDSAGRITALKTDMMAMNRLKSDIVHDVLDAIKNIGTSELGIPLGNVTGAELLAGRGPLVPVKIVPVGTAGAEFSNVFNAAGINQTRHQVILTIQADLSVLMPGQSAVTTVSVEVSVAETVIVGTVPDTYANFKLE